MSRVSYPSNENPEKKNSKKISKNFQFFFFQNFSKFFFQDFHYLDKKPLTWGCLYSLWEVPIARIWKKVCRKMIFGVPEIGGFGGVEYQIEIQQFSASLSHNLFPEIFFFKIFWWINDGSNSVLCLVQCFMNQSSTFLTGEMRHYIDTCVQQKPGFDIGNPNQGPIFVSESKIFFPKPKLFLNFLSFLFGECKYL